MSHYKISSILLFFLFLLTLLISPTQQAGQWSHMDLEESPLLSQTFSQIQQYALSQLSIYGILPPDYEYKTFSNIYTQVVAGTNWKFDLIIYNENEERTINVLVWQKLPQEEEKFHLSHVSVEIPQNFEGSKILGAWSEAINEDFDDIKKILEFGVKSLKEKAPETADLRFVKARSLETQFVNGKNYKFLIDFQKNDNDDPIIYQIIVYANKNELQFVSYEAQTVKKLFEPMDSLLGGWTELDPENLGSIDDKALKFADNALKQKMNLRDFSFFKVESAFIQVVAGIRYKYVMVYRRNSDEEEKKYQVLVWKKLDGFNTSNESYEVVDIKTLN